MGTHLDADAVARVVRRAIEIESGPGIDAVSVETVIEAAEEAGIAPGAVREAIAWERLGPPPSRTRLDRMVGGTAVAAERVIHASVADLLDQLDGWLTIGHHLRREVAERVPHGDADAVSIEWAKRDDLAASLQRSVRSMAGGAGLGSVRRVSGRIVEIDEHRSVVRLIVDRRIARNASAAASGGLGAASIAGGVAASAAAAPVTLVVAPGLAVAGGTALAARRRAGTLERELRRLLDQIDAGERPATIVGGVAQRIGLGRA